MSWILVAGEQAQKPSESLERRVPIESLTQGDIFSICSQATRFELRGYDPMVLDRHPEGRIMAKVVSPDGTLGADIALDYHAHREFPVLVWNHEEPVEEVSKPLILFERVRLKGAQVCGCILDLNKSKFPDMDIIVAWEQPLHGEMITEVHGHEIESLGEQLEPGSKFNGGEQTLNEIRQIVLDLRGKHERGHEDKTKDIVRQQIGEALKEHAAAVRQLDEARGRQVKVVEEALVQRFATDLKVITDACVIHVTAGVHDYELEQVGSLLANYADGIWRMACRVTEDQVVASAAAAKAVEALADMTWKSYFLTRFAFVRKQDGKWCVISQKGKRLGCYPTKERAVRRLRQVEYFKRHGENIDVENLESLDDLGGMR